MRIAVLRTRGVGSAIAARVAGIDHDGALAVPRSSFQFRIVR